MKTLSEVAKLSEDYLAKRGIASPKLEAEWLVTGALGLKRIHLYTEPERPIEERELAQLRLFLERRGKREPLQYLLGEVEFLGCTLQVNPSVLIPRPETEILADKIIKSLSEPTSKVLWDIGTGSGCLGIAIKKKIPALTVILSDNSPAALSLAAQNAQKNGVQVECRLGDLLEPFKGQKAHFVVSNPPYVADKELETLQPEVKEFEPRGALVSGPTGMEFYERFSRELPSHLHDGAQIWFEMGPPSLINLFEAPCWHDKKVEDDWSGHKRFFSLKFKEDFLMISS